MHILKGERLNLINADKEILEKVLESNEALAAFLKVKVIDHWSQFGKPAFTYSLNKLLEAPEATEWWTYLPIFKAENTLIGSGGFKGPVDDSGVVEIGYEIHPAYRGRGLATEMAEMLVHFAFSFPEISSVQAHTQGNTNASSAVLRKVGFEPVRKMMVEEEGDIWKWILKK